jgi:outer membrane protein assembly factor BamB
MKTLKNKTAKITIAIFLMFSMMASIVLMPSTFAHTPTWQIPTISFVNIAPDPIGVGQTATIGFWVNQPPPTAASQYGDRWQNITVKVTYPDGTSKVLGPFSSDASGGSFTTFAPDKVGNYTFQMTFPGQILKGDNPVPGGYDKTIVGPFIGDYIMPSTSNIATLTVQQEPASSIPFNTLPEIYWTRPINAENNNWYSLGGNWLGLGTAAYNASGSYNPWSTAPKTGHILWTKPDTFGGTVGGEFGGTETGNFYTNREYEMPYKPVIMGGIMYYEEYGVGGYPSGSSASLLQSPASIIALDLKTGKTVWVDNAANYGGGSQQHPAMTSAGTVTVLYSGQLLDIVNPNQYGCTAYLWTTGTPVGINTAAGTTTYNIFDAFDGTYMLSIVNGTGMTLTEDVWGDLIGYYVNSSKANQWNAPTLNLWNSTWAIQNFNYKNGPALMDSIYNLPSTTSIQTYYQNTWLFRPIQSSVIPFSDGLQWSAPLATNISGVTLPSAPSISAIGKDTIVMSISSANSGGGSSTNSPGGYFQLGYQIEAGYDANTGAQLWITNRTETPFTSLYGPTSVTDRNGVYVVTNINTFTATGYNDRTGQLIWSTVLPDANTYDSLVMYGDATGDTLYLFGLGGDAYAINIQTGTVLWHFNTGAAGLDSPYGVWPLWNQEQSHAIADGVMFLSEGHMYTPPLFRGARLIALNLTDGTMIWSILGFSVGAPFALADGVLTALNDYDNQIYAYGMGPSKLAVTAPNVGVTTSTPITISGTISDVSAGSQQQAVAANFPNGLPCVSDASMSGWMEYVYEQQPCPTTVTGVIVSIDVLDSNGNFRNIGTTTSDGSGTFAFTWIPDIPGDFTVIATFAGSESYYPSSAETHFNAANPAPTASPYPTVNLGSTQTYIMEAAIGIIVAVVIVGAILAMLMLRKRP